MKNINSFHFRVEKSNVLIFIASLILYLLLSGASYYLIGLKLYFLRATSSYILVNYFIAAIYLLLVIIVVFMFYLIGRRIDLKRKLLSSTLSLILGSYTGSLIEILITYRSILEYRLAIDIMIAAFFNIFTLRYFFFIAFTGIAIGYIKASYS
ncbi:MAG: hypothetical protein DRJ52_08070 [Thermoprotei archaeon]|nr:MAG: hypothetical protein DRJ52_08070 [Thermoprotei archaeon]